MLDGSVKLLDICSSSMDAFSLIKSCVQVLESSLRRRNSCETSLSNGIRKYFISKKQVNKFVCKCFGNMKRMQQSIVIIKDNDHEFKALFGKLNEIEMVSLTVFKSLLSFVYSKKSKSNGQSVVSKLIQSKHISCEITDKEDKLNDALEALIKNKSGKSIDVSQVRKDLEAFESTIREVEEGLESVFRCLIKTRVSLLNIANH